MSEATIVIKDVSLRPNPVETSANYVIAVEVVPIIFALGDSNAYLSNADGSVIDTGLNS